MDFVGWQNILAYQLAAGAQPDERWRVGATYHVFRLMEPSDAAYLATGTPWLRGDADFSRALANEVDLEIEFEPQAGLSLLAQFATWLPGRYQEEALGGSVTAPQALDPAYAIYVQASAEF